MGKAKKVQEETGCSLAEAREAFEAAYPEDDAGEPVGDSDFKWTARALRTRAKILAHLDSAAALTEELPEQLKALKGGASPLRLLARAGLDEEEAQALLKALKKKKSR